VFWNRKQKTGVDELCRGLPAEFATYMNYLRQNEGSRHAGLRVPPESV
jgi:hypothetical protein